MRGHERTLETCKNRKSRSRQCWIQIISAGYIFPGSPWAPGWEHQRVSGANPQLADPLRYQSRWRTSSLKTDKSHNKRTKRKLREWQTWRDHQTLFQCKLVSTSPLSLNTYSISCSRLKKLWGVDQVDGGTMVTFRPCSSSLHVTFLGLSGWTGQKKK